MYQELFSYMNEEHGLLLLESEMQDIIDICAKIIEADQMQQSESGHFLAAIEQGLIDEGEELPEGACGYCHRIDSKWLLNGLCETCHDEMMREHIDNPYT